MIKNTLGDEEETTILLGKGKMQSWNTNIITQLQFF